MEKVEFPDSFLIGHAVLDDDHRRLIAHLNKMKRCFAEHQGGEAREACDLLQILMDEHNDREEKILRDAKFPRLDEHIESHETISEACRNVLAGCGMACLNNKEDNCTTRLSISVIEHIVSNDLDFKSFLQDEGLAETIY